jgi:hypothetical protein
LSPLKQLPSVSPSLFGFSQAWIWKWSLDSASGKAAQKIAMQVNMVCFYAKLPSNPAILYMTLQAPTHFRNEMLKEAQFHVIWDSGVSVTVMPHRSDFVGHYRKPPISIRLKGLVKGLNMAGQGHVWLIMDNTGML